MYPPGFVYCAPVSTIIITNNILQAHLARHPHWLEYAYATTISIVEQTATLHYTHAHGYITLYTHMHSLHTCTHVHTLHMHTHITLHTQTHYIT